MAVLFMAVLAFAGLFIVVFWDTIRTPRRDRVINNSYETAPPPLLSPELVGRSAEEGWEEPTSPLLRNVVLVGLGVVFAATGFFVIRNVESPGHSSQVVSATVAKPHPAVIRPVAQPASLPVSAATAAASSAILDLCKPGGSFEERSIEFCEGGAAIRFDLLRLSFEDRFVVRPAWSEAAAIFVGSDSHAVPFTMNNTVSFATPETVGAALYDGYLVIGVGNGDQAIAREEALRDFAIGKLSGGDRSECSSGERVFSTHAGFDPAPADELKTLRSNVERLRRAARRDAKARGELAAAEQELARRQLFVVDAPAPIVIGITADPMSSDPVADMLAASRAFVREHAADLQIRNPGTVTAIKACARGEVVR